MSLPLTVRFDGELDESLLPIPIMGVDTTSPIMGVKRGYVRNAKNCYPGLFGGLVKRDGYATSLSSAFGSRSITGGIEFKTTSGSRTQVVFGTNGNASGGILGYVSAGAVTNISTGLSGTARPCLTQFENLLFFSNGADAPQVYDGSAARQVGITAPASAPTIVLAGGGSLTTNSNYIWFYTYYNSVTGAESSPSSASATTGTGANTKGTLTVLAGDSATADTIRVWRTVANGQVAYLDGTAAIGATSYVSTIADSALGTQMELDNTRITSYTSTPNYGIVCDNRVFFKTADNEVRWSKYSKSGPMPESYEVQAVSSTSSTYGHADRIIGLATAGSIPIVLKERSVGSLQKFGLPDYGAAFDTVGYEYEELSKDVCPVSHHAVVEVRGECIFLARDNVYGTKGVKGDLRPVGDAIQATVKALGFTSSQVTKVSAYNDSKLQLVYFAVYESSSSSNPALILVGDYKLYPTFRWTFYTQGTNTSTHPGIVPGCFFGVTNSSTGVQDCYFGNIALNGQLYKMDGSSSDGGSGIYFEVTSRPYALKNLFGKNLYKDSPFYAAGDGTSYSLDVAAIYDLSGAEENATSFTLSAGGYLWDNAGSQWDSATWATLAANKRTYQDHRKAFHQQLVFRQTSASAPVTLYGWGSTGIPFMARN